MELKHEPEANSIALHEEPQERYGVENKKVGYLTVVKKASVTRDEWLCVCVCGKTIVKDGWHLRNYKVKSCGCMTRKILSDARTKHGRAKQGSEHHNTFYVYRSMRSRCENDKHKSYERYGGRGITVCERWKTFENFLSDMGDVPDGMTLGRIDNSKGYSIDNCRWETHKQQARNRRSNRILDFKGLSLTLQEWAERTGICRDVIWHRIASGWSIADALTKPPKQQKNSRSFVVYD